MRWDMLDKSLKYGVRLKNPQKSNKPECPPASGLEVKGSEGRRTGLQRQRAPSLLQLREQDACQLAPAPAAPAANSL